MVLETLYYFKVSKLKSSRKFTLPNKLSNSRKKKRFSNSCTQAEAIFIRMTLKYIVITF